MDDEIDIERFILEVQIRPGIWDLQEAAYANRDQKILRYFTPQQLLLARGQ